MKTTDVVIMGGGPGGYVSAIRAAQLGLKVILVEKEHLGGICLNWGCIPTKALLRTAEVKHLIDNASDFGIKVEKISFDIKAIVARSRDISSKLAGGIKHLLKKNKVEVIEGHGKILKNLQVEVSGASKEIIQAKHIIIATGARARNLPGLEADGNLIWNARHAMTPQTLPKKLLIVGSGAIGIEFASFYNTLGVEVHVVEIQDRILNQEDAEISALALKSFEKAGIHFHLSSSITSHKGKKIHLKTPKGDVHLEVDHILLAVGIIGNTETIGLENTSIKVEKGQIIVNDHCETNEKNIYAIGDVTGAPWLAHKASHEGIIAAEKIAGKGHGTLKRNNIPGCTYSMPQVASIGLTEAKAKELGHDIKVGRFPYAGNGKAMALGDTDGLVKTIFDAKTGELLGAHMIGAEVTELVQGFAIGKQLETTEEDLMHTIFPHPTLSEMMHESVLNAYNRTIHF
jgi:dihydrolipoamide dehydrogenase